MPCRQWISTRCFDDSAARTQATPWAMLSRAIAQQSCVGRCNRRIPWRASDSSSSHSSSRRSTTRAMPCSIASRSAASMGKQPPTASVSVSQSKLRRMGAPWRPSPLFAAAARRLGRPPVAFRRLRSSIRGTVRPMYASTAGRQWVTLDGADCAAVARAASPRARSSARSASPTEAASCGLANPSHGTSVVTSSGACSLSARRIRHDHAGFSGHQLGRQVVRVRAQRRGRAGRAQARAPAAAARPPQSGRGPPSARRAGRPSRCTGRRRPAPRCRRRAPAAARSPRRRCRPAYRASPRRTSPARRTHARRWSPATGAAPAACGSCARRSNLSAWAPCPAAAQTESERCCFRIGISVCSARRHVGQRGRPRAGSPRAAAARRRSGSRPSASGT